MTNEVCQGRLLVSELEDRLIQSFPPSTLLCVNTPNAHWTLYYVVVCRLVYDSSDVVN